MKKTLIAVAAVALAACVPSTGAERVSVSQSAGIASVGAQLSVQRARNGIVRPLGYSAALQAAAQAHADYLSQTGGMSHTGPGGTTPRTRAARAGYQSCLTAENIARGQPDISTVISDWMASGGHRSNILNAEVTQFGFAQAGSVYVLKLARPC